MELNKSDAQFIINMLVTLKPYLDSELKKDLPDIIRIGIKNNINEIDMLSNLMSLINDDYYSNY